MREWPAIGGLRRRLSDRGAGRAAVRADRGQPFHHPRPAAAAAARLSARARVWRDRRDLTPMTSPYAEVIGDPIAHSKSPLIHRFWLERARASPPIIARRMSAPTASPTISPRAAPIRPGAAATSPMPHKQAVMTMSTGSIRLRGAIGAVNTVVPRGRRAGRLQHRCRRFPRAARGRCSTRAPVPHGARSSAPAARRARSPLALAARGLRAGRARPQSARRRAALLDESRHRRWPRRRARQLRRADRFAFDDRAAARSRRQRHPARHGRPAAARARSSATVPPGAVVYDIVYAPLETPLLARGARARACARSTGSTC